MNRKCLLLCIIFVGLFLVNFVFADTVYSNAVTTYYVEDTVNYTVQTFLANGTFNITSDKNVSILIVAGGGSGASGDAVAGGRGGAGGGGAGGLIYYQSYNLGSGNYNITVGRGGSRPGADASGNNGLNSSINTTLAAWGGGGGGGYTVGGVAGGSGGGGGGKTSGSASGGSGISGQGYAGGSSIANGQPAGAGGGGASRNGWNNTLNVAGNGSNGLSFTIYNGTALWYAGGGGGNAWETATSDGLGGLGGGGGGSYNSMGINGTNGTGGGGGAGFYNLGAGTGGNGIIILRYVTEGGVDTTVPTFTTIPSNASIFYRNESLLVIFVGADETGFDTYTVNNTKFLINDTGFLSNATSLGVGTYDLNITINDTTNNINWTIWRVTVKKDMENCKVLFNDTSPMSHLKSLLVWSNCSTANVLTRNGTTILNNSAKAYNVGAYNFSVSRNDTENYTYIYNESEFIVVDITPPLISDLVWKTIGGFTSSNLFYNQILDYVNVTASSVGPAINVYLTIKDPDNIIIINNQSMTNTTETLYNYSTNITLNKVGNWTINTSTFDEYGNVNSTQTNITVSSNTLSLIDGWYGYTEHKIFSGSEIVTLSTYNYDILEIEDNISTVQVDFANILAAINNSRNSNIKVGLNLILDYDYNTTALTTQYLTDITENFSTLYSTPYLDTLTYISLQIINESYTDTNLTNILNDFAQNITDTTNNYYIIYSKNYNSSNLDNAYIKYTDMLYINSTTETTFINNQSFLFKTTPTLNRIYDTLTDSLKLLAQLFHEKIIDKLRGLPTTVNVDVNASVLSNNDTVIFNNGSSAANFTINVSALNVIGKDVWDSTKNKLLFMNLGSNSTFSIDVDGYNASIVYFDDFDHIQMDSYTAGTLYKASSSGTLQSNYTINSTGWNDLYDLSGNNDIQIELSDPSYIRNQFITFYGWLNASVIDTQDWENYDIIIIADKNNDELDALNYSATEFYGYISVADYNNTDIWNTAKAIDVDSWLALNGSMNLFVDGLDYVVPGAGFETRMKTLVDYIQITKARKVILNTYTAYQDFATWGTGGVMKESCVNRWNGADPAAPTSYTRENWELELNKSSWYGAHNVPVLCQSFSNRSLDGTNLILNYTDLQNIYFASKVLGYDYFYLSQPDFQYAHDERVYNVGTNLDRTYHQLTADTNTYYRTYSNGIVYYNSTSGVGWIEDGKIINNITTCFYLYNPAADAATFNFNINNRDPTGSTGEYSYVKDWASGTWQWTCIDTTTETPINGMYLIEAWSGAHDTVANKGFQLGNNITTLSGVHSFYDSSATDAFTAYPYGTNWMVNLSINQTNKISVDTTQSINQYVNNYGAIDDGNGQTHYYTNITINSSETQPIEIWSVPVMITGTVVQPFSINKIYWWDGSFGTKILLNYTNTTTCDTDIPTWNASSNNTVNGMSIKVCTENYIDPVNPTYSGALVRYSIPNLTVGVNATLYVDTDIKAPYFSTIPANVSIFYNNVLNVSFHGRDSNYNDDSLAINMSVNDTRFNLNTTTQNSYALTNATTLAVGHYQVNISLTDYVGFINYTLYDIEINKSNSSCGVYFNATSPIIFPKLFIVYTNCTSLYTIYRNETSIANASVVESGAGYYNLTVQRTDTENYTNNVDSQFFTVDNLTSGVKNYVNNTWVTNILAGKGNIFINASLYYGVLGDLNLSVNNIPQNYSTTDYILNNSYNFTTSGVYNVSSFYSGNQNYSSAYDSTNVTITNFPQLVLNEPINYANLTSLGDFNSTITATYDIFNVSLYVNDTLVGYDVGGESKIYLFTVALVSGYYSWYEVSCNSLGDCNTSEIRYFTLEGIPQLTLNAPANLTNLTYRYIWFNATVINKYDIKNVTLYVNGTALEYNNSGINGTYNFHRNFASNGYYNWDIRAYSSLDGANNSETRYFTLSQVDDDEDEGGGGGSTPPTFEEITLDHINITWQNFYFNSSSYIYVKPLDVNDSIININISDITFEIVNNLDYENGSTMKPLDKSFKKSFNIIDTNNITEFTIKVTVVQGLKTISKTVIIPITEKTFSLTNSFSDIWQWIKENWVYVMIGSIIITLIFIVLFGGKK